MSRHGAPPERPASDRQSAPPKSSGEDCTPVAGGCQDMTFSLMFRRRYGTIHTISTILAEYPKPVPLEHVDRRGYHGLI
jgi:hypothetical protein